MQASLEDVFNEVGDKPAEIGSDAGGELVERLPESNASRSLSFFQSLSLPPALLAASQLELSSLA